MKKKSMKKKLLLLLVFCVALSGLMLVKYVSNNNNNDNSNTGEYLEFNHSVSRVSFHRRSGSDYMRNILVFTSYRKYNKYLDNVSVRPVPWHMESDSTYSDNLRKPKEFFKDNFIVVVELTVGSISMWLEADSIDREGNIAVTLVIPPSLGWVTANWLITFEMSKEFIPKRFRVEITEKRLKYPESEDEYENEYDYDYEYR